jgi:hypothetical protein
MRTSRLRIYLARLAVLVVLLCGCGAVGLLVGRAARISSAQAATERSSAANDAFAQARAQAYPAGYQAGYRAGYDHGVAVARARGRRAGVAAGQASSNRRQAVAAFVAAVSRALTAADGSGPPARPDAKCVEVGGGLCELPGPAVTHRPCPADTVADPQRGAVCVPELLIAVQQQATSAMGALTAAP